MKNIAKNLFYALFALSLSISTAYGMEKSHQENTFDHSEEEDGSDEEKEEEEVVESNQKCVFCDKPDNLTLMGKQTYYHKECQEHVYEASYNLKRKIDLIVKKFNETITIDPEYKNELITNAFEAVRKACGNETILEFLESNGQKALKNLFKRVGQKAIEDYLNDPKILLDIAKLYIASVTENYTKQAALTCFEVCGKCDSEEEGEEEGEFDDEEPLESTSVVYMLNEKK